MPVWSIARKDIRVLFRDRSAMIFIFGMPLIFTVIFGGIFSNQGKSSGGPISVLVVNQDAGPHGAELMAAMKQVGLKPVTAVGGPEGINSSITKGDYALGVIIPSAYSADLEKAVRGIVSSQNDAPQAHLEFREDPAQAQVAQIARGALAGAVIKAASPLYKDAIRDVWGLSNGQSFGMGSGQSPVAITSAEVKKRELTPGDLFIPGFAVYFVFFMANGVAATLLLERQEGTLKRMLSAPITRGQILTGKMLARALIGLLQTVLLFGIGKFTLHLSLGVSDLPGMALVALATVFAATGLGLLIATFGKTMEQIQGMTTLVLLMMGLLSGSLVPRQFLPETLQKLSLITPHAWALNAYQDLLLRHLPLASTLVNIGAVILFGIGFYILALARFRFE